MSESMVYDRDDETNWLYKMRNQSMERIHSSRLGFGWGPPVHQQKSEAAANFSVMKTIARKRNPKAVTVLNQLERLCMDSLDGKITDKQFAHGCKRVAKQARISNPVLDFLDDMVLNQSDIYPNRVNQNPKMGTNVEPSNPYMNLKNPAFEKSKPFRAKPNRKMKDIFGYNPAFDYGGHKNEFGLGIKNPAFDGTWDRSSKRKEKKMPMVKMARSQNPYLNIKNPFFTSQKKNAWSPPLRMNPKRDSGKARFDPWAFQNPAFADLKRSKKKNNPMGLIKL